MTDLRQSLIEDAEEEGYDLTELQIDKAMETVEMLAVITDKKPQVYADYTGCIWIDFHARRNGIQSSVCFTSEPTGELSCMTNILWRTPHQEIKTYRVYNEFPDDFAKEALRDLYVDKDNEKQ